MLMLAMAMVSYAVAVPYLHAKQNPQRPQSSQKNKTTNTKDKKKQAPLANDIIILETDDDSIPDSLLNPRWKIQRTTSITYDDLNQSALDLKRPNALKYEVTYNDTINRYIVGTRMGSTWLAAPIMMTPEEYMKWSEKHGRDIYFRQKNSEIYERKGKEKFDFSDFRAGWRANTNARNRRAEVWWHI